MKYSPGSVNESYKHQAEAAESQYCSSLSTTWEKSKKCTHLLWFQWLLSVDKRTSTLAVECIEFNSLEAAHSHSINSICRQRTAGVSEWQNIHVSAAAHCRNTIFVCFFYISWRNREECTSIQYKSYAIHFFLQTLKKTFANTISDSNPQCCL